MKNYIVKVTRASGFNDTVEKNEDGVDTPRKYGDIFNCTKERYLFLKQNDAVVLRGIEKKESAKDGKK
jgi:hypothetical protein